MSAARCPECGKPVEAHFAPFCSKRCQQIDLGRWLKGEFVIPGKPEEDRTDLPAMDDDAE